MKRSVLLLAGCVLTVVLILLYPGRNPPRDPQMSASLPPRPPLAVTPGPALISAVAALRQQEPRAESGVSKVEPSAVFQEFSIWANEFVTSSDPTKKQAILEQGLALARQRRSVLAEEIRSHPREALAHVLPWRIRHALPSEFQPLLESVVSGTGEIVSYYASPPPGLGGEGFPGVIRSATISGVHYSAFVYGRREAQVTVGRQLAFHGVAVGDLLAVHEDPVRILEPEEADALRLSQLGACALCGGSAAVSGAGLVGELGGKHISLCSASHAKDLNRSLIQLESMPPSVAFTSAAQSSGQLPPPVSGSWSTGTKNLLYYRLVFADDGAEPITEAQAKAEMRQVEDYYRESSYNLTAIITTVTPLISLPQSKMYYAVAGVGAIAEDAATAALAFGYDPEAYDLSIFRFTPVPGFTWGGLGGGGTAWIQYNGSGLLIHELGHCYGLGHANYWDTRRAALPANPNNLPFDSDSLVGHDNIYGAGDNVEYGDIYDVMGSGGGEGSASVGGGTQISTFTGHFNVVGKRMLGWLPDAYVATEADARMGTNRIYAHDVPTLNSGRFYAATVEKDTERTYWISLRSKAGISAWQQNGFELLWGPWSQNKGYSLLLDTTPGSSLGKQDAPVLIGRTYADTESQIYITAVGKGSTDGQTWMDVVVRRGPFLSNMPPTLVLEASSYQTEPGQPVTLKADATDSNGDPMAFFWDLGDERVTPSNTASLQASWNAVGDYVVRCEVSDMKGGVTIKHVVVRVGNPSTFRISGNVHDNYGVALAQVRVGNGSLTEAHDLAEDYLATYTDSDGAYTLVNLSNRAYEVSAFLDGYVTKPLNFTPPVQLVDQDAVHADFHATRLPWVTVYATNTTPPAFIFKRTGDSNTAFQALFALGGSATTNDYKAALTTVRQTNVSPNPFGPVTSVYPFYAIAFPTGVMTTSIAFTQAKPPGAGEERDVVLTLDYALQSTRVVVTNTNIVDLTGWEVVNVQGQDTWFQTYPDYVPRPPGQARIVFRGTAATQPIVSLLALDGQLDLTRGSAARVAVIRSGKLDVPIRVQLSYGGSAEAGSDYDNPPQYIDLAAQQTAAEFVLQFRLDRYLETSETVEVDIKPDPSYAVGSGKATVQVFDYDSPVVVMTALKATASEIGGDTGTIMVSRGGDLSSPLVVHYLVSGDAVSGRDYRSLPGFVTILAGQPSSTISIVPRDNRLQDGGNTVELLLSDSPTYNIGTPSSARVFIQDGSLPLVTIAATDSEAAEPTDPGEITVTRQGDLSKELVVRLEISGTATILSDYGPVSDQVRLLPNVDRVVLAISPIEDPIQEDTENIVVTISPSADYILGSGHQATVNLSDNDQSAQPGVGFQLLSSRVSEAAGEARVGVFISANPAEGNDVTVDYKITGGTAVPGVDYPTIASTGRFVFPHSTGTGENAYTNRMQLIVLSLTNNSVSQPDRTVVFTLLPPAPLITNDVQTNTVTLTNADGSTYDTNMAVTNVVVTDIPMNARLDTFTVHTLTIVDDDSSVITLEASDADAREENTKPGLLTIRRTRTNDSQVIQLGIGGSASSGADYQPISETITLPPGMASIQVPVLPVDDTVQEFREDVFVRILDAPGATLGEPSSATVSITDNDGTVEFTRTSYTAVESEGRALVPVRRTGDLSLNLSVEYSVTAGTARPGSDFIQTNGVLVFKPGDTNMHLPVDLIDNLLVDPPRSINLTLLQTIDGAPLGGQSTAVLNLLDDDAQIQFASLSYATNENASFGRVELVRLGVLTNTVTVDLQTRDGGALAGTDYVATNQTITFGPGLTSVVAQIKLLDDVVLETNETVMLVLTNAQGGSIGTPNLATLVIQDDECSLEFLTNRYRFEEYGKIASIQVVRHGSTVNPLSVNFATTNGTAIAGKAYVATQGKVAFAGDQYLPSADGSGKLDFQPGETNRVIEVRLLDNSTGDGDRSFQVLLSNPTVPGGKALSGSVTLAVSTNVEVVITDDEKPGHVDFSFNPGEGANGTVSAVAVQGDGKILIGGDFTQVDGVVLQRLARLHVDGYLDTFMNPGDGANGSVMAIGVQPDGRIMIGGDFTRVNGVEYRRLARLNIDGTVDGTFASSSGLDKLVRALAVDSNGNIIVGGAFGYAGSQPRQGLARLRPDGVLDSAFEPSVAGSVHAILFQADGRIVIGGEFTSVSGVNRKYVARLNADGTLDSTFDPGTGPDGFVETLGVDTSGRIVIGGSFKLVNGKPRAGIARLEPTGALDGGFDPGEGASDSVMALAIQPDGKILAAGAFTNFDGIPFNRYVRLNPDGAIDSGFVVGNGANGLVRALALQPDTAAVIGGDFSTVGDLPRNGVARIHGDDKFVQNLIQFSSSSYPVPEGGKSVTVHVFRSGDIQLSATASFLTLDGTAKAGQNYLATNGTLSFGPGETSKSFQVAILPDGLAMGDLSFSLLLTNLPPGFVLGGQLTATVLILDQESAIAFTSAQTLVDEGAQKVVIPVRRSGPSTAAVQVDYRSLAGTAVNGVDFTPVQGTIAFAAGESETTIEVPVIDDHLAEADETFSVELSNPVGAALGQQSSISVLIVDNDRVASYQLTIAPVLGGAVNLPSGSYPNGTNLSLKATPEAGFTFVTWEGTTNTSANPLNLVMDRDYALTARFRPLQFTYTFESPFLGKNLSLPPWNNSSPQPWLLQSAQASGPGLSVRSGGIEDGAKTTLQLSVESQGGTGAFEVRVSSETNWDGLEFRVDGEKVAGWSGEVPWTTFLFSLPKGQRVLTWTYAKDANYAGGLDAVFIDNIYLPVEVQDTTPEAAVLSVVEGTPSLPFQLRLEGRKGTTYILQGSMDLRTWEDISTHELFANSIVLVDPNSTVMPHRFYRAITKP